MPLIEDATLGQELERFEQDMQWIYDHYGELKQQYPNEFVAVYGGQVIAYHRDTDRLLEVLSQQHKRDVSDLAIKFIYKEPPNIRSR